PAILRQRGEKRESVAADEYQRLLRLVRQIGADIRDDVAAGISVAAERLVHRMAGDAVRSAGPPHVARQRRLHLPVRPAQYHLKPVGVVIDRHDRSAALDRSTETVKVREQDALSLPLR